MSCSTSFQIKTLANISKSQRKPSLPQFAPRMLPASALGKQSIRHQTLLHRFGGFCLFLLPVLTIAAVVIEHSPSPSPSPAVQRQR
jgi:hypothetical protein